jgi:hypothetical protein
MISQTNHDPSHPSALFEAILRRFHAPLSNCVRVACDTSLKSEEEDIVQETLSRFMPLEGVINREAEIMRARDAERMVQGVSWQSWDWLRRWHLRGKWPLK